jgi:ubiquinone/menaquinone biosynthesis C-methylase UbiE
VSQLIYLEENMDNYDQLLIDVYDRATPKALDFESYTTMRMVDLLDMVDIQSVTNMLDLGCGTELAGVLAASRNLNLHVLGIDISFESILQARRNIRDNNLQQSIRVYQSDVLKYDFNNLEFDLVFASSSIILFSNVQKSLELAYRLLVKNGQFAFSSYSKNSFFNEYITEAVWQVLGIELPDVKDNLNTVSDCICRCKEVGFNIVEINEVSYDRVVNINEINWDGSWIHPTNPLGNITDEQKSEVISVFNKLVQNNAINGYLKEERRHLYTLARK